MPTSTVRHHAPQGQPTRGKTALNRLRQIDTFVALAYPDVLTGGSPLVIDVGYGAQAWTALEMYERWLPLNPRLRLLGLEIDPERVAVAQPYARPPTLNFALGGFNVSDALQGTAARVIRAYNVLRQYDETAVGEALTLMARGLEPGGLLIEGTSTPTGRMVAFDVYRRAASGPRLIHEALVFGTNFREGIEPSDFQTILPKRLIHHMGDGSDRHALNDLARFFALWGRAVATVQGMGVRHRLGVWVAAGHRLREQVGYPVDPRHRLLRRGYLMLHAPLLPIPLTDGWVGG